MEFSTWPQLLIHSCGGLQFRNMRKYEEYDIVAAAFLASTRRVITHVHEQRCRFDVRTSPRFPHKLPKCTHQKYPIFNIQEGQLDRLTLLGNLRGDQNVQTVTDSYRQLQTVTNSNRKPRKPRKWDLNGFKTRAFIAAFVYPTPFNKLLNFSRTFWKHSAFLWDSQ